MRGVGNVSSCASGLELIVAHDYRSQFAEIEMVEDRDRCISQFGIRLPAWVSFDRLVGQPWIGSDGTEHRRERLLRRKSQGRCIAFRKQAAGCVLDFPDILVEQDLFAFEVLQSAARGAYVKGRPP